MYWPIVRRLARARVPALTGFEAPDRPIALTALGRALLDGDADWVAENGLDRWVGGIRLDGDRPPWRWDEATRRPVPGA